MMPVWILPIYPFVIAGPLASVILKSWPSDCGTLILIGGICIQGLGFFVALFMWTLYITCLTNSDLPDPSKRPGMYVAVGLAAYTANTFVALSSQAGHILAPPYLGITSISVADVWKAIGIPAGIFLWLLGFWFFALSTVAVVAGVKKIHYTLSWWAIVFPNAGLTIALIQIANEIGSGGLKWLASIATILLVIA